MLSAACLVACDQMVEVEASLPSSQTFILIDPQIESRSQRNLLSGWSRHWGGGDRVGMDGERSRAASQGRRGEDILVPRLARKNRSRTWATRPPANSSSRCDPCRYGVAGMSSKEQIASVTQLDFSGRLAVILGTAIVGLATVFWIVFLGRQAEIAWRAQVDLVRFERLAARVNGNEWRATAQHEVAPEVAEQLAQDKKEMLQIVASMKSDSPQRRDIDEFSVLATTYVRAVDRELDLLEYDRYLEAQQVDEQEVDPRFQKLEQMR